MQDKNSPVCEIFGYFQGELVSKVGMTVGWAGRNKIRRALPERGTRQVVKTEIRLWYFCGQMRNRRSFHCGDFQFWWTVRGSNPRPRRCERRALPAELTAQISHFSIKKVMKNRFLRYSILRGKSRKSDCWIGREPEPWDVTAYGCEPYALPTEL